MRWRRWPLATALLVYALAPGCASERDRELTGACPPATDSGAPWDFRTYAGSGFTMCVPADAIIRREPWPTPPPEELDTGEMTDSAVVIRGPELNVDSGPVYRSGPTYELEVFDYDNPTGRSLEQFVLAQAEEEAGREMGMTARQLADQNPRFHLPVIATVAGQQAAWLTNMPLCADCTWYRVYFARGRQVVAIQFLGNDAYNVDPLRPLQRMLYAYVVESFRWQPL